MIQNHLLSAVLNEHAFHFDSVLRVFTPFCDLHTGRAGKKGHSFLNAKPPNGESIKDSGISHKDINIGKKKKGNEESPGILE